MKKEKVLLDKQVKFRLTTALKEKIDKYCEENGIILSEFLRNAVESYLK